jgi:hypothetical protein
MNILKYDSMEISREMREIKYLEKPLWSSVNNLLLLSLLPPLLPVMVLSAFLVPPATKRVK